ncbi:ATP-binding protein [Kitasatospora purpeofusca]|uniref:ATP-binding protein n=1 Tax=Kitasatospora purpeofusca TaxID=67352 RepID=UPI002E138384|nr:ATP-binding protein [Kitasatospora purpeofusca]
MHSTVISKRTVPARRASIREVRKQLRADLSYLDLTDDQLDAVLICASELTTNALTHSIGGEDEDEVLHVEAAVHRDRSVLRVTVTDPCKANTAPTVRPSPVPASAESGRGLLIVKSYADASGWGTRRADSGTVRDVWFEIVVALPDHGRATLVEVRPELERGDAACAARTAGLIASFRAAMLLPTMAPVIRVGVIRTPGARAAPVRRAA